jgi:hypothetical protein
VIAAAAGKMPVIKHAAGDMSPFIYDMSVAKKILLCKHLYFNDI